MVIYSWTYIKFSSVKGTFTGNSKYVLEFLKCITFDYTATELDGTPKGIICEQTTFCLPDVVHHAVVDSADLALDQIQYMI
jgi:hypothetical protein